MVVSDPNTVATLSVVKAGSKPAIKPVARSYDGFAWEGQVGTTAGDVPASLRLSFACSATACTVDLPPSSDGTESYLIKVIAGTAADRSTSETLARFLMQASFGPSRDSLAEIVGMGADAASSIDAWLDAQVRKTPSWPRSWANFSLL
jgi:hypothetical protein